MKSIFSAYCSKRTKTQCSDLTKSLYDQKYFKLQATAKKIPKKKTKKKRKYVHNSVSLTRFKHM